MNRYLAILTVATMLTLGVPAALIGLAPAVAGKFRTVTVTKVHNIAVQCLETDQYGVCVPGFAGSLKTSPKMIFHFTANPAHCTPIRVEWRFDGRPAGPSYVVAPGERRGGPVTGLPPGAHTFRIVARDAPGGTCADGPLRAWNGTLEVTTTKRVRR